MHSSHKIKVYNFYLSTQGRTPEHLTKGLLLGTSTSSKKTMALKIGVHEKLYNHHLQTINTYLCLILIHNTPSLNQHVPFISAMCPSRRFFSRVRDRRGMAASA